MLSPLLNRAPIPTAAREPAASYFMDSPTEGERLALKTDPVMVERHLNMTGLHLGMRALDVACGSGVVTRLMALRAGVSMVTGVDASEARVDQARALAADSHLGIAYLCGTAQSLPLDDNTMDYTHARMLFQYLADPRQVLDELIRVTRPGGSIVLIDLDGQLTQLHPMEDTLRADLEEALRILRTDGFDPYVGRKLYGWCVAAGLTDLQVWIEPYQLYTGGRLEERDTRNWREKLETATAFLGRVTGDHERWKRFRARYLAGLMAPDALYYASVVIVRGVKRR